jgi:tRNA(His) 5'-end guanylyltransferase
MTFDDFDRMMRMYEKALDIYIPAGDYIVVRLDGSGFSKFTETHFKKPFDSKFHTLMEEIVESLMRNTGVPVVLGYTQSDEISLLLERDTNVFNRKTRKLESLLAAHASAVASLFVGEVVTFDARVIGLPEMERVSDYFKWRIADSERNALNGYVYWNLRKDGKSGNAANKEMSSLSVDDKKTLLRINYGIDFPSQPEWCRKGVAFMFEEVNRLSVDRKSGEDVEVKRRELCSVDTVDRITGEEFLRGLFKPEQAGKESASMESNTTLQAYVNPHSREPLFKGLNWTANDFSLLGEFLTEKLISYVEDGEGMFDKACMERLLEMSYECSEIYSASPFAKAQNERMERRREERRKQRAERTE